MGSEDQRIRVAMSPQRRVPALFGSEELRSQMEDGATPPTSEACLCSAYLTMPDMLMPKIVYGTAWYVRMCCASLRGHPLTYRKKDRTTDLVYTALKAGFRGVDTACQPKVSSSCCSEADSQHYREDLVGEGVQRAIKEGLVTRDELWLQTKYGSLTKETS